ncbi:hypothetical protein JQX13_23310 [Archangium violaceum]|uniref:hypothetical protein n=1 Tax=Archangium violaceum TaxID=83451 RepID=UPI00193B4661|nr:hypothetical protein [Archangium violaceum]QRK12701.1 hypothetical protein JQX13_23310 [Archangium violaceum]
MYAHDEALQSAWEHGFLQNAGLAAELAARFWREGRVPTIALLYARAAYRKWGAHGNLQHLEDRWPLLRARGQDGGPWPPLEIPLTPDRA